MNYKTHALIAVAAAGLIAATMTATDAQKEKWAEIDEVKDGEYWMPFKDGMIIDETMPKFRGTSGGMESIQVTLNGEQVGNNNKIGDAGKWTKQQQWPLEKGEYHVVVRDCGPLEKGKTGACTGRDAEDKDHAVLFNGTIHVGRQAEETQDMASEIERLKAVIAELEAQVAEMLQRMNSVNAPTVQQPQEPQPVQVPEQVPGQYYIRLLNSTNSTFGIGDQIHFEGRLPACPEPIYGTLANVVVDGGGHMSMTITDAFRTHHIARVDCGESGNGMYRTDAMLVSSANQTDVNGYITVHERMHVGEHYLRISAERGYDGHESYTERYYTEKFTLG